VGIYTALLASPTERVLCLACDMPFVTPELVWALVEGSSRYDVYVPRHGPYVEPLCSVYAVQAAGAYEAFLDGGGRRIYDVYPDLVTGYLDVDDGRFGEPEDLFMNTNTPEDLEQARLRAQAEHAAAAALNGGEPSLRADGPEGGAATRYHGVAGEDDLRLSPAVRAFVRRSPFPVVSFVGKKKSGKTSVLDGVIRELTRRGLRVGVLKHDSHGFDPDVPGTDSYRLRGAGAVVTGVSSPDTHMWITHTPRELSLEELMLRISEPVDLLITEGFKMQFAPKVEVSRHERSTELIGAEDELVGIVSDQRFPAYRVPQFDMGDFAGIADLLEQRVIPLWGVSRGEGR
jgi:molybdopterin-guanine dinucleotide biosynthesis protein MobB